MFSAAGAHPLSFLTVGDTLYGLMTSHSPLPNRMLVDRYRSELVALGYEPRLLVTQVVGRPPLVPYRETLRSGTDYDETTLDLLAAARPHLARPYREITDADLMTCGALVAARKPASAAPERASRSALAVGG
jgi:hypothetical protein